MNSAWAREFWLLAVVAVVSLLFGWWLDLVLPLMLLGLTAYLGWQFYNIRRLEKWLVHGRKFEPPHSRGIWGEVYEQIFHLQKRHRNRKRKLKAYLKRFRQSTDAIPDGTVVLGKQGEIEWWNDSATTLLGLRSPQDLHQRITNLIRTPEFADYFASRDYGDGIELSAPCNDEVILNISIVPYAEGQCLLVARDITRLLQLEQMRRDFVANVSHELRTPLTVVNGYLEAMADADGEVNQRWGRALTIMQQQSERMQQIVNDLLLLSRLELEEVAPDRAAVAVPELVKAIVEDARTLSGDKAHRITAEVDQNLWLLGIEKELHSAFSNLVLNAVRYTPAKCAIQIRWYKDKEGAHFEVKDSGEGIAEQHLSRLTERFYRVDAGRSREGGGTGLGLAIVKHILMRHGAELSIDSQLGQGSVFRCDFPLTDVETSGLKAS